MIATALAKKMVSTLRILAVLIPVFLLPDFSYSQAGTNDPTFNVTDDGAFGTNTGANHAVHAMVVQSDKKIIIGGEFNTYNNSFANHIARLNINGTLDTSFNSGNGTNGDVFAIAIQTDKKIIIGGNFSTYNGMLANGIVRLNTDGSVDTTFKSGTGANQAINQISIEPRGNIIIGGAFTLFNEVPKSGIARLINDGSLDSTFNTGTGTSGMVTCVITQLDGKTIIGGQFSAYNGTPTNQLARLHIDGSLDMDFKPLIKDNNFLNALAIQPDGKIIIAGGYSSGFSYKGFINRLAINGDVDTTFNAGYEGKIKSWVSSIAITSNGKIVIGGRCFVDDNFNNTLHISCLNIDGSVDHHFEAVNNLPLFQGCINTLAIHENGKIAVGGLYTQLNGVPINNMGRVTINGRIDVAFNMGTGITGIVRTTTIQTDKKIIVGGAFAAYNFTPQNNLLRLYENGDLDTTFHCGTGPNSSVFTTAIQANGGIIIGGAFTAYNGNEKKGIARLHANGSLDVNFNTGQGANGSVYTTAIQPDGKIIIGGNFTAYNGVKREYVARILTNGSLDTTFIPGPLKHGCVYTIALHPNGKIIIGGKFKVYNNDELENIAFLKSDGSLDPAFKANIWPNMVFASAIQADGKIIIGGGANDLNIYSGFVNRLNMDGVSDATFDSRSLSNYVQTILLQTDEKLIVGGKFADAEGPCNALIRLTINGSLDDEFKTGRGANGSIYTCALQADEKIIVGGELTAYNTTPRNRIARIFSTSSSSGVVDNGIIPIKLHIYPNPVTDYFTIGNMTIGSQIKIINGSGKVIYAEYVKSETVNMETTNYANGIYIVINENNGNTTSSKFIVNR